MTIERLDAVYKAQPFKPFTCILQTERNTMWLTQN